MICRVRLQEADGGRRRRCRVCVERGLSVSPLLLPEEKTSGTLEEKSHSGLLAFIEPIVLLLPAHISESVPDEEGDQK